VITINSANISSSLLQYRVLIIYPVHIVGHYLPVTFVCGTWRTHQATYMWSTAVVVMSVEAPVYHL